MEIQAPPQYPLVGHVIVGVQVDPVGQPYPRPTVQTVVLGVDAGVEIQAPPQYPEVGHVMVGVHVDPVGQPYPRPTVQIVVLGFGAGPEVVKAWV